MNSGYPNAKIPIEILEYFSKIIENELGIIYNSNNYFQLENRIEGICKFFNLSSVNDLISISKSGTMPNTMKQYLLDTATNNETSFFRDPKIFNFIQDYIVPNLIKKKIELGQPNHPIQIWSAACSAGQEPYSLAMIMDELGFPCSIKATDISEAILAKAIKAQYSQIEVQRGLGAKRLVQYFNKDEISNWNLSPSIKNKVDFEKLNLRSNFNFYNSYDLVLCRNVLIYQNIESKQKILDKIYDSLKSGGYLILGSGESLLGIKNSFTHQFVNDVSFYQKK